MRTQVAIVGAGPGGCACAIHLAGHGISSVIVERESFPRFHIGESLTEQSGVLLRELGLADAMRELRNPVKFGVRIYGPAGRSQFWIPVKRRDPEGGLQDTFTWQVRRSTFDQLLLERARAVGAQVVDGAATRPLVTEDGTVRGVEVRPASGGAAFEIASDVLVDASGQRTFLANAGITGPKERGRYHRQVAIYSHFTGAVRDSGPDWGNTLMFFQRKHHWAWFIPLDDAVTSIGFVVPTQHFRSRGESTREYLQRELHEFNTELTRRTQRAEIVHDVHATTNYSYRVTDFSGRGWLCIGDAHRFIDPLFSFGVNVTMADARRAAGAIREFLAGRVEDEALPFRAFEQWSERGIDVCQTVLDGFWETTMSFGLLLARYEEDFIDLLAGRVWDDRPYPALAELREGLARQRAESGSARPSDDRDDGRALTSQPHHSGYP
jgi:flavin-dependent dehydrogenase